MECLVLLRDLDLFSFFFFFPPLVESFFPSLSMIFFFLLFQFLNSLGSCVYGMSLCTRVSEFIQGYEDSWWYYLGK